MEQGLLQGLGFKAKIYTQNPKPKTLSQKLLPWSWGMVRLTVAATVEGGNHAPLRVLNSNPLGFRV